jgi:replicative DNA helicase
MTQTATNETQIEEKLKNMESCLWNIPAERSLLAMLTARPDGMDMALEQVPLEKFFGPTNRCIYWLMEKQAEMARGLNTPADFSVLSLLDVPKRFGLDRENQDYIAKLTDDGRQIETLFGMARKINVDTQWSLTVNDLNAAAHRVFLMRQAAKMILATLNRATPIEQIIENSQDSFLEFAAKVMLTSRPSIQFTETTMDELSRGANGIHFAPLPFLSNFVYGFQPGKVYIIAARTKVGKSTFQMCMALDAAKQGIPCLYLDTEMSREEVARRAISSLSGIAENLILTGEYLNDPVQKQAVEAAHAVFTTLPFQHENIAGLDVTASVVKMHAFKRHITQNFPGKVGVVFYDYLKLPSLGGTKYAQEFQILGDQTSKLKNAAGALGLVAIAGVQESRGAKGLSQSDYASDGQYIVAGSDRIVHMCDLLLNLRNLTKVEGVKVAKHFGLADGGSGDIRNRLRFNQVLHITLQRSGGSFEEGIPLHFQRGKSQYRELAYQLDSNGQCLLDERGKHVMSKELGFLHSKEFAHKPRSSNGKPTLFDIAAEQRKAAQANASQEPVTQHSKL